MKRRRHLSKEERDLWDLVAARTERLHKPTFAPSQDLPKKPEIAPAPRVMPISKFRVGSAVKHVSTNTLAPTIRDQLTSAPVQMDHKSYGKMKRGKISPEGRLDLHGLTLAEAHPELVAFILTAHAAQKRLVLVITGKGKDRDDGGPIPTRFGILRHQVPQWLRLPPLSHVVLQVTPAHLKHGGDGAYYVYLKRSR